MATFGFGTAAPAVAATPAPAAAAPATSAAAPAAGSSALVAPAVSTPATPATALSSAQETYATLLEHVQSAWSGSVNADDMRVTIMQHLQAMASVSEQRPVASARQAILGKNVTLDGQQMNLSDERTVQFILDISSLLRINELDALRLVKAAAQALSAENPSFGLGSGAEVQAQLRARAVELHFQRRFNLLLATLDLVLMERDGAEELAGASDNVLHVRRVVAEAVAELVRLGLTANVLSALEQLNAPYTAPPSIVAPDASNPSRAALSLQQQEEQVAIHRAQEQSYLLRLLFALFKPAGASSFSGAGGSAQAEAAAAAEASSEDIIRLVQHIQSRSASLAANATAAQQQQAQASSSSSLLYPGSQSSALPSSTSTVTASGPESGAAFECYVLLCSLMEGLETKYRAVAQAAAASARVGANVGGTGAGSSSALNASWSGAAAAATAAQAAVANADADLYYFCSTVSKRVTAAASWSHDVFRCGTLLVWALFLKRVRLLYPGGTTVAESDEEVQQLVLEGLGGAEGQGFWIHLRQTLATNVAFAPLKRSPNQSGSGVVDEEEEDAASLAASLSQAASGASYTANAASAAATSGLASASSSAALVEELGSALGEFVAHVLLLHSKEMDLLRREDKRASRAYDKSVVRHEKLIAQQAQQAQMQYLQHGGYGGSSAAPATVPVGELPPPPLLNFSSFLGVLAQLCRAVPALVPLLWSDSTFETFLAAELHDSKNLSGANIGLGGAALGFGSSGAGVGTPGSLLSGGGGSGGGGSGGLESGSAVAGSSIFTSDSPFVLGYLEVLSSLCVDAAGSLRVYGFVRGCSRISWEMLCVHYLQQGLIAHYMPQPPQQQNDDVQGMARRGAYGGYGQQGFQQQAPYRPPQAQPPPPLTTKQLRLLSSLLRLLASLLRPSSALQRFFALHADYRLLETSFGLLALRLPVQAKARVLELLAALARLNPELSNMVWERLERSQVLPTVHYALSAAAATGTGGTSQRPLRPTQPSLVPVGAPLEGLLFDLEEVENQLQLYPLTASFLHLLVTLMESAPLPAALGQGVRGVASPQQSGGFQGSFGLQQQAQQQPLSLSTSQSAALYGLAPYVSFVHSHVFLNLPHRGYQRPVEQAQLAELCLGTFARLAEEFLRDMSTHADSSAQLTAAGESSGSMSFQARHQPLAFAVPDSRTLQQQAGNGALQSSLLAHPAYTLLRDMLQNKEVLSQILGQMYAAFVQLEGGAVAALHPAVEGTLLQSARLLWLLLEQEETLVQTMQQLEDFANKNSNTNASFGLQARITPLSTLLLQHQPAVLTLARCAGYVQSRLDTPLQQLLRDRLAKERAKRGVSTSSEPSAEQAAQISMQQQQYYDDDGQLGEDESALAAAAAAGAPAAAPDAEDGRTTEAAFFAASCLLLLSQCDEARLVHILEASGNTAAVVAAAQRQLKNAQLPSAPTAEPVDPDLVCNRARLVLVDVLLSSLSNPSPAAPHLSLALLLLGFDVATPAAVRGTDLSRSPRRSVLDALLLELAPAASFAFRFPSLAHGVHRLLYSLLASPLSSGALLRLLQSSPSAGSGSGAGGLADYLLSLLRDLPLVGDLRGLQREWAEVERESAHTLPASESERSSIALVRSSALSSRVFHSLSQLSWLLRSVSLHLFGLRAKQARESSASGHSSAEEQLWRIDEEMQTYLIQLGFLPSDDDAADELAGAADEMEQQRSNGTDWFAAGNAQSASGFLAAMDGGAANGASIASGRPMLMLNILSNVHAFLRTALPPSFQLESPPVDTDSALAEAANRGGSPSGVSSSAAQSNGGNFEFASTKYFDAQQGCWQYSLREVYAGCAAAGLPSALRLSCARRCLEWNVVSMVLGCSKAAFDSWRQCVEVVLATSADVLMRADAAGYEAKLLHMLQAVLSKLAGAGAAGEAGLGDTSDQQAASVWTALGEELSGLALTLIAALRDVQRYTSSLPAGAVASGWSSGGGSGSGAPVRSTQWHSVLALLVSSILSTRHSPTRSNLYAVFLHYMLLALHRRRMVERALTAAEALAKVNASDDGARDEWIAIQAEQTRCDAANLSLLSSHNLPLLKLVVGDALEGSSKLRALSFRFLSVLLVGASPEASALTSAAQTRRPVEQRGPSRFFGDRSGGSDASLPAGFTSSLLQLFSKNNLLMLFLNQLRSLDSAVQTAIHASGARALQGYELLLQAEASLGFLLQLASEETGAGAVLLLDQQAVRVLAGLSFLHTRPSASVGYSDGEAAAASNLPSPLEKFQSVHLLALQIISAMLRALPAHTSLLSHAQQFVSSQAQRDALAALLREARPAVTPRSIDALTIALSLLHAGAAAEHRALQAEANDAQSPQDQQRKLQRISSGARFAPQPRQGSSSDPLWEGNSDVEAEAEARTPFFSILQRQQSEVLSLLLRYFRPSGDARLRSYLSARLRERQLRSDAADAPLAHGADNEAAVESDAATSGEVLLEAGDSAVQRVARQLLSLLTLLQSAFPSLLLFGPQLEGELPSGAYGSDEWSDGASAQLASLLTLLQEAHQRRQDALQQQTSWLHSVALLQQSDNDSGNNAHAASDASSLATLELELFPPSAPSTAAYHALQPEQRRAQLALATLQAARSAGKAAEQHAWSIEHLLLTLHRHVRIFLPTGPSALTTARAKGAVQLQVSASEFRAEAEDTLLPLLRDLLRSLAPQQPRKADNFGEGSNGDQRVAPYAGGNGMLQESSFAPPSRLLPGTSAQAAGSAFAVALLQRILKHISG